jgi:Leucine-rich repeat (LRR) protein
LSNLKNLNLNWNNLETIPKNLPNNLEILSLWGNKIQKIPKSIENLRKLRILDLNFNKELNLSKKRINLEKNGLIIYR